MEKELKLRLHSNGKWSYVKLESKTTLGQQLEDGATTLTIELPAEVYGAHHFLEFIKPSGVTLSTIELKEEKGENGIHSIKFLVSSELINEVGRYAMQYVGRKGLQDPITIKSELQFIDATKSANAGLGISKSNPDIITWFVANVDTINQHLNDLSNDKLGKNGGELDEDFNLKAPKINLEANSIHAKGTTKIEGTATLNDKNIATIDDITAVINSAPEKLDTLKELADALGNDENFATNVLNLINSLKSSKLDKKNEWDYEGNNLGAKVETSGANLNLKIKDNDGSYITVAQLNVLVRELLLKNLSKISLKDVNILNIDNMNHILTKLKEYVDFKIDDGVNKGRIFNNGYTATFYSSFNTNIFSKKNVRIRGIETVYAESGKDFELRIGGTFNVSDYSQVDSNQDYVAKIGMYKEREFAGITGSMIQIGGTSKDNGYSEGTYLDLLVLDRIINVIFDVENLDLTAVQNDILLNPKRDLVRGETKLFKTLNDKVEKKTPLSNTPTVYGHQAGNAIENLFPLSVAIRTWSVVYRNAEGKTQVETPNENDDPKTASNKEYVDNKINALLARIEALEKT